MLRTYANDKGVIDSKWNVTTGNKNYIYNLARKSYFAAVEQGDGGLRDFIHTPTFILIDKKSKYAISLMVLAIRTLNKS